MRTFAIGAPAAGRVALARRLILDVPALVALNLRAIAEYATYYGFDDFESTYPHYCPTSFSTTAASEGLGSPVARAS